MSARRVYLYLSSLALATSAFCGCDTPKPVSALSRPERDPAMAGSPQGSEGSNVDKKRLSGGRGEPWISGKFPSFRDPEGVPPAADAVLATLEHPTSGVLVQYSPNGSWLATAAHRTVTLWDARSREKVASEELPSVMTFSPTGRTLAIFRGDGDRVDLVAVPALKPVASLVSGNGGSVDKVVFSPDERTIVGRQSTRLIVWDVATKRVKRELQVERFGNSRGDSAPLAYSPDGKTLAASVSKDGVSLFDTVTWEVRLKLKPREPTYSVAFSPDGRFVATGALAFSEAERGGVWALAIELWDARSGKPINPVGFETSAPGQWMRHKGDAVTVSFSPDGKLLASDAGYETVKLWDVATQRPLLTLRFPTRVCSTSFSPDGKTLAVSHGSVVELLDVAKLIPKQGEKK